MAEAICRQAGGRAHHLNKGCKRTCLRWCGARPSEECPGHTPTRVENVWGLVGGWGYNGGGHECRRRRDVARGSAHADVALVGARNIGGIGLDEVIGWWAWVADA